MERTQMCREFGDRVRSAREAQRLTRDDLAEASQLAVSTLARVERGKVLPNATTVMQLAGALGIPLEELAAMAGLEIQPQDNRTYSERRGQSKLFA